jgi:hypothetical protein
VAPSAPLPTDPTSLATERVPSRNSSIADCSRPRQFASPSAAIATTLVRRPFGPVSFGQIARPVIMALSEGSGGRRGRSVDGVRAWRSARRTAIRSRVVACERFRLAARTR